MIEAKVICDSVGPASRLHTQRWTYPKFVHQESLRHRRLYFQDSLGFDPDFSFSVSSSRAIPFQRLLEEVRSDASRAAPAFWGAEQKGMSPGEELPAYIITTAEAIWQNAAKSAADIAESLSICGVHKSICNRIIEPYIHVHCLVTGSTLGWMNFFGLRLDKAADPTLRALAEAAWIGWNESEPRALEPGQWHLPFVDQETHDLVNEALWNGEDDWAKPTEIGELMVKISVARSAHLSYESFSNLGTRMTVEECIALHDRFVKSVPMHASPLEHQATPDEFTWTGEWTWPKQGRNLGPGWRQYRAMLSQEALAPLPAEYR